MNNYSSNIMLIDDQEVFIHGLSNLLTNEKKYNIAGVAKSQEDALKFLRKKNIDLAILDLSLNEMKGIELLEKLKEYAPATKTLIFSMQNSPWIFRQLLNCGIDGFITKTSSFHELKVAIDEIILGNNYFCSKMKELYSQIELNDYLSFNNKLTKREMEVIHLIYKEFKTKEIANRLKVSINTVETHRKNIMSKLQVSNSIGIIKKFLKRV